MTSQQINTLIKAMELIAEAAVMDNKNDWWGTEMDRAKDQARELIASLFGQNE